MSKKEDSKDFLKKLNDQFKEFVDGIFGEETADKISDYSSKSIKSLVDFGDQLIETLKLEDNELVKKSSEGIKDLLKQAGLLEDDQEEDF
ncbi:MAG: hypothetical protein ACTSWY_02130 [Promethearchaeota archaeon]